MYHFHSHHTYQSSPIAQRPSKHHNMKIYGHLFTKKSHDQMKNSEKLQKLQTASGKRVRMSGNISFAVFLCTFWRFTRCCFGWWKGIDSFNHFLFPINLCTLASASYTSLYFKNLSIPAPHDCDISQSNLRELKRFTLRLRLLLGTEQKSASPNNSKVPLDNRQQMPK